MMHRIAANPVYAALRVLGNRPWRQAAGLTPGMKVEQVIITNSEIGDT